MKNKHLFYYCFNQQKYQKVLTSSSKSDIENGVKVKMARRWGTDMYSKFLQKYKNERLY
jgi:hypothetical protein